MNKLKSLVLGAFMLGTASASGSTVNLDSLVVNTNDNDKTVVCVPENVADRQARDLLSLEYEEGWVFDKSCWHEVLRESGKLDYGASENDEYAFGYVYPEELSDLFNAAEGTLKFRHTHPYGDINQYREMFAPLEWNDWEQAWIDLKVDGAAPNDGDIDMLIWMQNQFRDTLADGVLIGQISSEFGVTDFYLTEEGREFFRGKSNEETYEFAFDRWNAYMQTDVPTSDNFVDWINTYTSSMNHPYFRVEFRPYENLDPNSLSIEGLLESEKQIYYDTYE